MIRYYPDKLNTDLSRAAEGTGPAKPDNLWWRMSLLQQDSRGHLTFMAVNREIPKYLDATLWNRGFVDTNGKYYELWNAQAQYYTE